MRIIWRTKEIEIRLWGRVCGLKHKGQRPDYIVLSEAEEEELDLAGEKGVAYRKRLQNALPFSRRFA